MSESERVLAIFGLGYCFNRLLVEPVDAPVALRVNRPLREEVDGIANTDRAVRQDDYEHLANHVLGPVELSDVDVHFDAGREREGG